MKQFKRIIAMIMCVAMVAGLAVTATATPATPTTSDTGTITVAGGAIGDPNADNTQIGHDYYAYQIFKGKVLTAADGTETLAIEGWGAHVNGDDLLAELKASTKFGTPNIFAECTEAAGVAMAISGNMTDNSAMIDEFTRIAMKHVNPKNPTKGTDDAFIASNQLVWNATDQEYKSKDLPSGYYLVLDKGDTNDPDDFISKNLIRLVGTDVTLSPKGTVPTVDKGVTDETKPTAPVDGTTATVNIGDEVYYTLKGTLSSELQEYDKGYYYAFEDTMSKGLTFDSDTVANQVDLIGTDNETWISRIAAAKTAFETAQTKYVGTGDETNPAAGSTLDKYNNGDSTKDDTEYTVPGSSPAVTAAENSPYAALDAYVTAAEAKLITEKAALAQAEQDIINAPTSAARQAAEAARDAAQANVTDLETGLAVIKPQRDALGAAYEADSKEYTDTKAAYEAIQNNVVKDDSTTPATYTGTRMTEIDKYGPSGTGTDKDTLTAEEVAALKGAYPTDPLDQQFYDNALAKVTNKIANDKVDVYLYNKHGQQVWVNSTSGVGADSENRGLIDSNRYKVGLAKNADGRTVLTVSFDDLRQVKYAGEGARKTENGQPEKNAADENIVTAANNSAPIGTDYLVVVYKAVVNKDAVIGNGTDAAHPGNENDVKLKYSNDPNTRDRGESTGDDTTVFTFSITVDKINKNVEPTSDDPVEANKEKALLGAEFYLYRELPSDTTKVQFAVVDADGKFTCWTPAAGVPKPATNTRTEYKNLAESIADPDAVPTVLKPVADPTTGKAMFKIYGLDTGTYFLNEKTVPNGMTPPAQDFKLELTATVIPAGTDEAGTIAAESYVKDVSIKLDDGQAQAGEADTGATAVTIENSSEMTLPETGGIGTTIFYIVGGVLVVGAAVVMITRKRVEG